MKIKNVFDEILKPIIPWLLVNSFIEPGHHSTIGNLGTIIYKQAWCAKIIDFLLLFWDFTMLHKTLTHGYSTLQSPTTSYRYPASTETL